MTPHTIKASQLHSFLAAIKRDVENCEVRTGKGPYQAAQVRVDGKWVVIHSSDKHPDVLKLPPELAKYARDFGATPVARPTPSPVLRPPSRISPEEAAEAIREYYKKCAPHEAVKVTVEITHSGAEVFITTAGSDYLRSQGENALNIRGEWIV